MLGIKAPVKAGKTKTKLTDELTTGVYNPTDKSHRGSPTRDYYIKGDIAQLALKNWSAIR
jgi:hypothetical protein